MGRKKLPIKRIEDKNSRRVTFSKRRTGLIKKARDLSVLCDLDVALVVFSAAGRLYEFSAGDSVDGIVQRHKNQSKEKGKAPVGGCETESGVANSHKTCFELLEIVERQLEESNVDQLSVTDLLQLEEQLRSALEDTRCKKTQLMMRPLLDLQEQETKLEEENKALKDELAALSMTGGRSEAETNSTPQQPRLLQFL